MKETINAICAWLKTSGAVQGTHGRSVASANERMAGLVTRVQCKQSVDAQELALVAIDLCPLAKRIKWTPDSRNLMGLGRMSPSEYIAGANRALSEIIVHYEQVQSRTVNDKLDQVFALLDGYCRYLGTDLSVEVSRIMDDKTFPDGQASMNGKSTVAIAQ